MPPSNPTWFLGDLSGWDAWLASSRPAAWQRRYVGAWIADLCEKPWQWPSVPVRLDPPTFEFEIRTAVLGEAGDIAVDYLVNNETGRVDIDRVGRS